MDYLEINGPDIPDGVYEVVLTKISEPKTVTAKRGPNVGESFDLREWTFTILSGECQDKEIEASTSTNSGPRSKMYQWLTALLGGKAPDIGSRFAMSELIGRAAIATVAADEQGWPRITNLSGMAAAALGRHTAKATGAPTNDTPVQAPARDRLNMQPAAAATAAPVAVADKPDDDLPF